MGKECCHCEPVCVTDCPDHVATASYTAVVGDHTITLLSPDENCNFIGYDCIVETPSVTNSWSTLYEYTFPYFLPSSVCNENNCCAGSQEPGNERAPATYEYVQTAYEENDKYIRWEQEREQVTVQLYDAGSGNLRILVTVLKEILYMVGVNSAIRGGYRVGLFTFCTPRYTDSGGTDLPQIDSTITYADPVWDDWPEQPDPDYPPCNAAESNPEGCEFTTGATPDPIYSLQIETIGPFDSAYCNTEIPECIIGTFSTSKVVSRVYLQNCTFHLTAPSCEYGGARENYRVFGYYYYYSDPFPCDAFPSNPIALKREPYTDIAATTNYESVCGQSYPYRTPAVSKDLTISIT